MPVELRLRAGGDDTADQAVMDWDAGGFAEPGGKPLGLVEFALALFGRVQWDRHYPVPTLPGQLRAGRLNEQLGEERLKPERPLVFVAMDYVEDLVARDDRRASRRKLRLQIPAVAAVKRRRDCAFKGKPAARAETRLDLTHLRAALRTDVTLRRSGPFNAAGLAYFRIEKA